MKIMHDIFRACDDFAANDFNHRNPNTIFISVDLFHDLLRNVKPEYLGRNPSNTNQWFIIGMDVLIVENKMNFIHVVVV